VHTMSTWNSIGSVSHEYMEL